VSKPYPKYKYQSVSKGLKPIKKEAFLKAINGSNLDYIYSLNPLKTKGWCYFCLKKGILQPQKKEESETFQHKKVFQFNQESLIEVRERGRLKPVQIRGKQTRK
jgi:hypothetical protein